MNHFELEGGELYAEGVPLAKIAEEVGTPVYVYSSATLERHYTVLRDALVAAGLKDPLIAFAVKANSKSTFWYKPASFKTLGVTEPKTLDDLFAIADKYKAAGKVPFATGGKSGWPLTDYFENLYIRVATPQMYNDLFVTHKVAWTVNHGTEVRMAQGLTTSVEGSPD